MFQLVDLLWESYKKYDKGRFEHPWRETHIRVDTVLSE